MIQALLLWWSTMRAYPELAPVHAAELAAVALDVATAEVPADLVIAIARVESHFDRYSVSRGTPAGRRTGHWTSRHPGRGWTGPYFCGLVQARAATWRRCLELQDLHTGLAAGVGELQRWHRYAHGDVRRMLAGHGCGMRMSLRCGSHGGSRRPYHARVLAQRARIST